MARILSLLALTVLALGILNGEAQPTGPLTQFADNVRQMHIVARYLSIIGTIQAQVNVIQTVTAVAVRSPGSETFWLVERDHVDPEFFYRQRNVPRGSTISFFFFLDTVNVALLIQGTPTTPFEVFKMSQHYAVVRESRGRLLREIPIATDPQVGESAIIALPQGGDVVNIPKFVETPTTILEVPSGDGLFSIVFTGDDSENNHGAPIFVQREGAWKLAGIRVSHGRNRQPERSAAARLPTIEELLKPEMRVLSPSEYRLVEGFAGEIELELHNVQEPKNAKNVRVTVEARINAVPRTFQEIMDIEDGRGTKTIRLGRRGEQIEVQRVILRFN